MPLDLNKANRERLIGYLRRKGEKGISGLRKEELLKMAKKFQRKNHRGGEPPEVMSAEESMKDAGIAAYNTGNTDFAKVDLGPPRQVAQEGGKRKHKGGQQNSGQTFFPPQYFNPNAPLPQPNDPNTVVTPYGKINAVSGSCRNLAPFPHPTNELTGGKKKGKSNKKKSEKKSDKKSDKKSEKKSVKKQTPRRKSLWDKLIGLF